MFRFQTERLRPSSPPSALANEGNGPARLWMVRYSDEFVPDEVDRANFCRETLTLLAEEHASGSYMMESLEDVKKRRAILRAAR